jgi:hypothetical protein
MAEVQTLAQESVATASKEDRTKESWKPGIFQEK